MSQSLSDLAAGPAVLFVDDEPALRSLAVATLQLAGYEVLTAADGAEALEVFRVRAADVQVVILDLTMPGPPVDETLRELRRMQPQVRVLLSSGHSEEEATRHVAASELAGFLQKPYLPRELIERVRERCQ